MSTTNPFSNPDFGLAGPQAVAANPFSNPDFGASPAAPKRRSLIDAANDTVIEAANAAAGTASAVGNFVSPGNAASKWIDKNIVEAGEANQTDVVKAEKARYSQEMDAAQGVGDEVGATLGYVGRNPLLAAAQAAGSFAGPGLAVKGAGQAAGAAGFGAKGSTRAGLAAGAGLGAAGAGGDAAGTAYDLSREGGATDEQAVAAARGASVLPAAIGAAGGLVGAERLVAGAKGFGGGLVSRALKTGAVEGVQEAIEEGVTQYEGQRAAVPFNPDLDPMKGVAGAATMGAVLGGATGAGASVLTKQNRPARKPSEELGLNPDNGPMSKLAAAAVDSKPLQLAHNPDPMVSFPDGSVGTQSQLDAYLGGLPEGERAAARAKLMGLGPQAADSHLPPEGWQQQYQDQPVRQQDPVADPLGEVQNAVRQATEYTDATQVEATRLELEDAWLAVNVGDEPVQQASMLPTDSGQADITPEVDARVRAGRVASGVRNAFDGGAPNTLRVIQHVNQGLRTIGEQPLTSPEIARIRRVADARTAFEGLNQPANLPADSVTAAPAVDVNADNSAIEALIPERRELQHAMEQSASGGAADLVQRAPAGNADIAGDRVGGEWVAFGPSSGTLGVARAQMPQIDAEHRGALVNYLKGQGITSEQAEVPAHNLKPTQAEFSETKVRKASKRTGGDRAILVSSDGYIVDGHHQWLAKREAAQPVKVLRLEAPIAQLLPMVRSFPSARTAEGAQTDPTAQGLPNASSTLIDNSPQAAAQSPTQSQAPAPALPQPTGVASATEATQTQQAGAQPQAQADAATESEGKAAPATPTKKVATSSVTTQGIRDLAQRFRDRHAKSGADTDRTFAAVLDGFARDVDVGKRTMESVQPALERYQELAGKPLKTKKAQSEQEPDAIRSDDAADATEKIQAPKSTPVAKQKAAPTPMQRIDDVGEKIGGARKDVWSGFRDDMGAVPDEAIAAQPLSKVWPQPDYQKLIEAVHDASPVAMVRSLRDAIPTKPRQSYKVKRWAEQVKELRTFALEMMDGQLPHQKLRTELLKAGSRDLRGIVGRAELYEAVGHSQSLEGISFAEHFYTLYKGKPNVTLWAVEQDAKSSTFGNWPRELATGDTKEQALEAFKTLHANQPKQEAKANVPSFDLWSIRRTGEIYVGKKIGRNFAKLAGSFKTVREAREYRDQHLDELATKLEKYKETPLERSDTNRPRVGQDMREAQNVTPEQFREAFGFRGVEFGNWVEQGRRQQDLNDAFDALMDMAAILQLPPKAISLNGELGLAFGARGAGGKNPAAAHYERGKVVINLTKKSGAGSLGHEWWHAVDNYFARMRGQAGGMLTQASDVSVLSRGPAKTFAPNANVRLEMVQAFAEVIKAINNTSLRARAANLDSRRVKEYWGTDPELSARAFESYLIAKLEDQNASNDYLANVVDEQFWEAQAALGMQLENSYPYAKAGEVPVIRAAFDHFFSTVETKDTDKGVAMFSRTERPAVSNTTAVQLRRAMVQRTINSLSKGWVQRPSITVVDSMEDIRVPEAVREADAAQRSQGATGEPEGFWYQGQVYLVASALPTSADATRVLYHEVLGHHGLRGNFGEGFDRVLDQVAKLRRKDVEAKAQEYGLDMANPDHVVYAAEEVLAELAQTRPDIGFVQRAISAIRNFLRSHVPGMKSLELTDADIVQGYLLPARGWVERATKQSPERSGSTGLQLPSESRATQGLQERNLDLPNVSVKHDAAGDAMLSRSSQAAETFVPRPDGGVDYGQISAEMGKAMRRQAGAIRLRQGNEAWGLTHIEMRHGRDVVAMGYSDARDFVSKVAQGFTKIYSGRGAALDVVIDNEARGMLIVSMEPAADGDFYDIKTATPIRRDQFKNEKPLWERTGPSAPTVKDSPPYPRSQSGKLSLQPTGKNDNDAPMFSRSQPVDAIRSSMGSMTSDQERAYLAVAGYDKVPTLRERFDQMRANLGLRMKQALVDQFAPIAQLDQKAYMLARMSKGSDGTLEAAMLYGRPFLRDGVPDVDMKDGGFANVLAGLKGEHDRFLMWVAAFRAENLKSQGKENLFSDQDITSLKTLNDGQMADGSSRKQAYAKALMQLNSFNESVLRMAKDSGLIDQDAYDLMKDQPYVPFYRLMEEEGRLQGPSFSKGLTNQKAWKKLKGGTEQLNADLLQNMLLNWGNLYAASARNRAALAAMDAADKMAVAYKVPSDTKGAAKVMRDGMTEHWMVEDPYLLEAISALNYQASPLMKPLAKAKQWLTMGVTVNPTFKIRNLVRDVVSSMAMADLSYNPAGNVAQGWKLTAKDSQVYASMLASGGVIKFGTQEQTDRARKQVAKLSGVMLDQNGAQKLWGQVKTLYAVYDDLGDRTENINRAALYDRLIKKGHSHADASFMARDLMDFSMGGSAPIVRFLTQSVPFLNARMQGLYKLGRAAKEDPRRFATVAMAVSVASLGLLAAYADDEDWKRREDWDRDSYWWFKVGDTAFRIPKPFEVGAIGTLAERTAEAMFSDEMDSQRFMERISHMVSQTFAFDPIPQAVKPLLDIYSNKDSFTGRAIESQADQRLRPQDRYNEKTSEVARFLGQMGLPDPAQLVKGEYTGLSPKQVDHLLRGYFSWVATAATTATDQLVRPMLDRGDKPDMRLKDVFIAGNFVEGLPTGGSRYVSAMYEQSRAVEQAFASYRDALVSGDRTTAAEIMESDGDKIRSRASVATATKLLAQLNSQSKRIEADINIDGSEKRARLNQIEQRRHEIAQRVLGKAAT